MMQGDQYRIPIELKHEDGSFITAEEVKDVEIYVGTLRKLLSNGSVIFDKSDNLFYVFVSQRDTFLFLGDVNVQARVLYLSGDVVGIDLGAVNFGRATSKVVLK